MDGIDNTGLGLFPSLASSLNTGVQDLPQEMEDPEKMLDIIEGKAPKPEYTYHVKVFNLAEQADRRAYEKIMTAVRNGEDTSLVSRVGPDSVTAGSCFICLEWVTMKMVTKNHRGSKDGK